VAPIWVVGVDGSDLSFAGLATVADMAERSGTELAVVHVRHMPTPLVGNPGVLSAARPVLDDLETEASDGAHRVMSGRPVNWRFEVREGDPADELGTAAREARAELIAIRGHSHGALGHLFLGSVAFRLLQRAPTNVLVLR
jgi:nucleotide-binding universal stress UspA family protein